MSSRNSRGSSFSRSSSRSRSCSRSRSSKHYRSNEGKRRRNNYDEDSFTDLSHDDRSSRSYSYSNSHSSSRSRSRSRSRGSNTKNYRLRSIVHVRDNKQLPKQQHNNTASQLGASDVFYLRHKDKICKLSLTEKLDRTYLSKIFNIDPNDIIGFEMDGLLIQLSNNNLASLIGGRVIKLNVMSQNENECETKTENIQIIEFHSHNDWGESAVKQMNEWLQKPTKPEREIVHIRRKYVISDKHGALFWWTVSYRYLPK